MISVVSKDSYASTIRIPYKPMKTYVFNIDFKMKDMDTTAYMFINLKTKEKSLKWVSHSLRSLDMGSNKEWKRASVSLDLSDNIDLDGQEAELEFSCYKGESETVIQYKSPEIRIRGYNPYKYGIVDKLKEHGDY